MEINNSIILSVINERKRRDADLFFVDVRTIGHEYGYEYIKRKKYYGLRFNGVIVIEPIYDKVLCLSTETAALNLHDKIAVYNIKNREFISQFDYIDISKEGIYWKLKKTSHSISLYDTEGDNFLGDYGYSDYGIQLSNSQYFWAKRGKFYDYIKRETGQIISLPGVIMAYDTQYGMFGKDEFGKISYFDESGIENVSKLRKIVSDAGGYLTLTNLTFRVEDIIDVYGNILNI